MKIYRITYENLTFGGGKKMVTHIGTHRPNDLEDLVFHNIHRYHGNHEQGHGDFTAVLQEVSRDSDEELNRQIQSLTKAIEHHKQTLRELVNELDTPYEEIGEPITINYPELAENI